MKLLNEIQNYELIEDLYKNNFRSTEVIINEMNLEIDSIDPSTEQNSKYGYGELTKEGVKQLYDFIKSKVDNKREINFCDIGSGNGKICIHLSIISNFKKIYGIEINEARIIYSKTILEKFDSVHNVEFIKTDATQFNFDDINIVFINDILFERDDIENIIKNLKKETHLISTERNSLSPLEKIYLSVDWMPVPLQFNYYKI